LVVGATVGAGTDAAGGPVDAGTFADPADDAIVGVLVEGAVLTPSPAPALLVNDRWVSVLVDNVLGKTVVEIRLLELGGGMSGAAAAIAPMAAPRASRPRIGPPDSVGGRLEVDGPEFMPGLLLGLGRLFEMR